jgi:hypothetical protein
LFTCFSGERHADKSSATNVIVAKLKTLFVREFIGRNRLEHPQTWSAKPRRTAANDRLPAQPIQKSFWRNLTTICARILRVREFMRSVCSANFRFPPIFCGKAARKYQGGRAQKIILR